MSYIYRIEFSNGAFYLGSSKRSNFKRKTEHLHKLRHNKHQNKKLQNAFNKHGEPSFIIHEKCEIDQVEKLEQFWLNCYWGLPWFLNLNPNADGHIEWTNERREKLSRLHKGKKQTKEHVCKRIQPRQKKVYQWNKDGSLIKLWDSIAQAERELKIRHISVAIKPDSNQKTCGEFYWSTIDSFPENKRKTVSL